MLNASDKDILKETKSGESLSPEDNRTREHQVCTYILIEVIDVRKSHGKVVKGLDCQKICEKCCI